MSRLWRLWLIVVPFVLFGVLGCRSEGEPLVAKSQTFAELRTIKRGVTVTEPGESARKPYAVERLVDGHEVRLAAGGLAWIRRDGGVKFLVAGPAALKLRADGLSLEHGKVFVDTPVGVIGKLTTARGVLQLSAVRASVLVSEAGALEAYVLAGAIRHDSETSAGPGEQLTVGADGKASIRAVSAWDDWTGGLATTDRSPQPAPFGVGTVGARKPGDRGKPRFAMAIQRLDVRVSIDGDLAITEVEQVFANPSSDRVEGLYSFRTPVGATLALFGVDRKGKMVWGRVKEREAAAAQYQANVYEGSREDPALLVWDSPGVYKARLYPIETRETRRVITRYAEWLGRQGPDGERRLYVYPMAAEGAEGTLPRIEEMRITLDLEHARADDVRVGMKGKRQGSTITVQAYDFTPRADFAVELYDGGVTTATAYRADHTVDRKTTAKDKLVEAEERAKAEAPYLLVPVRPSKVNEPEGGLDLAIIVDTSAATDPGSLAIARAFSRALLAHLGPDDRVAIWAGDATLRPIAKDSDKFRKLDPKAREALATSLAQLERGGATDLGAIVAEAASKLDPDRRHAVVYVGDGRPTVGESGVLKLRERLRRLPRPVRLFGIGVGDRADLALLDRIARGGFSVRVGDASSAALAALRLLETAERPVWLGASVDLGPGVDRVFPREPGALVAGESAIVIGRIVGKPPTQIVVEGSGGKLEQPVTIRKIADRGDLRRRWAEGRLSQLLDEGAGSAAVVEIGTRSGIITPFTSLYVPTAAEAEREVARADEIASDGPPWWKWLWSKGYEDEDEEYAVAEAEADNKEGGTGTRAKGEEGAMGSPTSRSTNKRYAVAGPKNNPKLQRAAPLEEAKASNEPTDGSEFGMIGLLNSGAGGLGLSGTGEGGGGKGKDIGLGDIGTIGHGAGSGTGQGFGSGHGRLGGSHRRPTPKVRMGATTVSGQLPPEVIQRIVRQNFGRFRGCYERGLANNPNLEGRVSVRFVIGRDGSVSNVANAGSDLPDGGVVSCVVAAFPGLSFPQPEGGIVTVTYPISFSPETGSVSKPAPKPEPVAVPVAVTSPTAGKPLGLIGHFRMPCAASAGLPFEERRILWTERLRTSGGSAEVAANVYYRALSGCEAPSWRERTQLLVMCVNALVDIRQRVLLWRRFVRTPAAADVIYRAILTRVRTAKHIRELHEALGLKHIDDGVLRKALARAKTPGERVGILQSLVATWPDDLDLSVRLLHAFEDAADDSGGRALARSLRRRSDASTSVRTAVGEFYLRLASRGKGAVAERDRIEARRTFGEIVEFAPEDPLARRLLGDLLRAHGWYEEALRQYETLAELVPDDATVPILRAATAQGMGRTEEAVRWTEKAAEAGSPDPASQLAKVARSFASVFLSWARSDAREAGRKEEAGRLLERARRLTALDAPSESSVRVSLTWAHPELRPELWSGPPGAISPAMDGDPSLGISQVMIPVPGGIEFELRLAPEDAERAARLGAEVVVTVVSGEGTRKERIDTAVTKLATAGGEPMTARGFRVLAGKIVWKEPR